MRTTDITRLLPPKTTVPTPQRMATRGTVTVPPAGLTDDTVTVTLPSYSADYGWPCRWVRQGNTLPAIGAECLVLWDETGAGTVVQWAGAFDVTRTVRGTVSSAGAVVVGSDFTAVRNATGDYTVTFTPAFSGVPSVALGLGASVGANAIKVKNSAPVTVGSVSVYTYIAGGALADSDFHFIAVGP